MINLAAVYGDGWDGGALVNPRTRAEAETRDAYAVLLLDAGRVRLEIRAAGAEHYLAAIRYDDDGRRVTQHEFRPAPDEDDLAFVDGPDVGRPWIGRDEAGAVVCFVSDMLL